VVGRSARLGRVLLWSTIGYGLSTVLLAQGRVLGLALLGGLLLGACDAMATTIRQAAVQLETPDDLRGRVSAIYQMASRGGPALGDLNIGWLAAALGPLGALTVGGFVPVVYAGGLLLRRGAVSRYAAAAEPAEPAEPPLSPQPPDQREIPTGADALAGPAPDRAEG
jgi:hypothetical protein